MSMSVHVIRCRRTREAIGYKLDGGICVCSPPSFSACCIPKDRAPQGRPYSKAEIEQWLRELGAEADAADWQFPYKEGWRMALTRVLAKADDAKRPTNA